jgi:4'-phosphopantetheinyl transferase
LYICRLPGLAKSADADAIALWLADPARLDDAPRDAAAHALLDDDERAREERFLFERDRRLYVAAHALLRTTLSRHAAVAPGAWRFSAEPSGRPVIVAPIPVPPLGFSLTHCPGLVGCAVVAGREIGVDVEAIRDVPHELAASVLAPAESAALAALPIGARAERFYALWTLKEAYVKARGTGLALPLPAIAFAIEPADGDDVVRFEPAPELGDDPARWTFAALRATAGHRAACCVATPPGAPRVDIALRWASEDWPMTVTDV